MAHLRAPADVEGVHARVLARLHPAVVDAAARDDEDIRVLADVEIVVYALAVVRLGDDDGDVHALVLGVGGDEDVDAGVAVLPILDADAVGAAAPSPFLRMLYAPSGTRCRSATCINSIFSNSSMLIFLMIEVSFGKRSPRRGASRAYDNLSVKARQALVPRREGNISSREPTRSILPAESTTILSAMFRMRS